MKYPEFRDAEYSTTNLPAQSFIQAYGQKIAKCLLLMVLFVFSIFSLWCFFSRVLSEAKEDHYLGLISVGSALVTVFSALISVLTLLSSKTLSKYEDDIILLQTRYLEGKRLFKWEFLKRSSCHRKARAQNNYYISSACYKLYSGKTDEDSLVIVIPILSVDFHDIPCFLQIIRIKKFLPEFLSYINIEQKKYDALNIITTLKAPNYYIPLPYHLMALYRQIIIYKIIKSCIEICFLLIIGSICVTIIGLF